jgi:hypothetical protein
MSLADPARRYDEASRLLRRGRAGRPSPRDLAWLGQIAPQQRTLPAQS